MSEAIPPVATPGWQLAMPDEAAVARLAAAFARHAAPPAVVWLRGDLGAGKTTFARAWIHALGFAGYVKSPSYGLLETYPVGDRTVLHLDLYRIEDPEELEYLAIRDLFGPETLLLVEWPDRGRDHLPQADLVLEFGEENGARCIRCRPISAGGAALANKVLQDFC